MASDGYDLTVAFVCTGNICRSPIAANVLTTELHRAGVSGVHVISAGIGDWYVGAPADDRAAHVLRTHGYPPAHIARQVDDEVLGADLIVAMDHSHLRSLKPRVADPRRVRLLSSFDQNAPFGADVLDPFDGDAEAFEHVIDIVHATVPGLLRWIRTRRRSAGVGWAGQK